MERGFYPLLGLHSITGSPLHQHKYTNRTSYIKQGSLELKDNINSRKIARYSKLRFLRYQGPKAAIKMPPLTHDKKFANLFLLGHSLVWTPVCF